MKYVFDALTYQKYVLVRLQRVGAGLSFVSHQKSVFWRVCLNKLLSPILQEKHVLVLCAVELRCFQRYCTGKRFPASLQ